MSKDEEQKTRSSDIDGLVVMMLDLQSRGLRELEFSWFLFCLFVFFGP